MDFRRRFRARWAWFGLALALSPAFARIASACDAFLSAQDVLTCALQSHPDLRRGAADLAVVRSEPSIAGQRPNPELNNRTVFGLGDTGGDALSEINFAHTFELGGKRDARIGQAKSQIAIAEVEQFGIKERVALEVVLELHRLRQIDEELKPLKETLETYRKIQALYRSRPFLDPEQQSSLAVFRLAEQDVQLKQSRLLEEKIETESAIALATGTSFEASRGVLPLLPRPWPKLEASAEPSIASDMRKAVAKLEAAEAGRAVAKSQAYPDLKFGPSLEPHADAAGTETSLGFNFALPLPLYHRNGAERSKADLQKSRAELEMDLTRDALKLRREKNLRDYRQAVASLGALRSTPASEHASIDSLFERGMIPAALVIETHQQFLESLEGRNRLEMRALQALWNVYALDGRILEEKI